MFSGLRRSDLGGITARLIVAGWILSACGAPLPLSHGAPPAVDGRSNAETTAPTIASVGVEWEAEVGPTVLQPDPAGDPSTDGPDEGHYTLVAHAVVAQVTAYAGPGSSNVIADFSNPTIHGGPLVFQALTEPGSELVESGWLPVLLPMRPNGTTGWIRTADVELTRNPYRIEVDVDDFILTVFRGDQRHFATRVGIGVGETPTPLGSFYLLELLRPSDPGGIYGPYAYGLNGFSETLSSFAGGDGVIGIHGTNQPEALGTRVSHGCIRVDNDAIVEMADYLPLGTPVVIDDDPASVQAQEYIGSS